MASITGTDFNLVSIIELHRRRCLPFMGKF
jgi:hypothetical protein